MSEAILHEKSFKDYEDFWDEVNRTEVYHFIAEDPPICRDGRCIQLRIIVEWVEEVKNVFNGNR